VLRASSSDGDSIDPIRCARQYASGNAHPLPGALKNLFNGSCDRGLRFVTWV
jgi:hypothetical protein